MEVLSYLSRIYKKKCGLFVKKTHYMIFDIYFRTWDIDYKFGLKDRI